MCDAIDITIDMKSNDSEVAIMLLQNVGCVNLEGYIAKNVLRLIMHALLFVPILQITWRIWLIDGNKYFVDCVNLEGSNAKYVLRLIMHAILFASKLQITLRKWLIDSNAKHRK